MAQISLNDDTNHIATNTSQSQASQVQATLDRIEQMEAQLQSTKDGFLKTIHDLAKKIQHAARDEARNPTAPKSDTGYARAEADCKEFFDDPQSLTVKIKKLAQLIRKSKHFVAFTGAGISTAAGIADFRSGINTSLDTGAGKWAKQTAIKQGKKGQIKQPKKKKKSTFKAIPTASHMALVALMTQKPHYLKYLISQNTDGLHRRSGIPPNLMSELHGNSTLEICDTCNMEYMRDYHCRNSIRKQRCHDHTTGRYCTVPDCKGRLKDTIINFSESLPQQPLRSANDHSEQADLFLSLGSSLTVSPAANMPEVVGYKWDLEVSKQKDKEPMHNLCIVNLQKTNSDELCSLRIFAKIDDVMIGLMKELEIDIPKWHLYRFVKIKLDNCADKEDMNRLSVCGVDTDGISASIFTKVRVSNNGEKIRLERQFVSAKEKRFTPEEYVFHVPKILESVEESKEEDLQSKGLVLELAFYKHYEEPNVFIQLNEYLKEMDGGSIVLKMEMDPMSKRWNVGTIKGDK
eukprot:231339_1